MVAIPPLPPTAGGVEGVGLLSSLQANSAIETTAVSSVLLNQADFIEWHFTGDEDTKNEFKIANTLYY
jgi:hypothetical protein